MTNILGTISRKVRNRINKKKVEAGQKIFLIKSKYGFKVILDATKDVDKGFLFSTFEDENFNLINKIAQKGWNVIDVGANIGLYTLLFSRLIGSEGNVYSFEPSDEAFFRLQQNIKLNNLKNVTVLKKGVSDKAGVMEFHITEDDAYNSLGFTPMKEVVETKSISVVTLDEFVKSNKIEKVDVLKIDTEGADYLVAKGASELLKGKNAPFIFCEYNRVVKNGYDFSLDSMVKLLESYSYLCFEISNMKLKKFDEANSNSSDLVCLKENHKAIFKNYFE